MEFTIKEILEICFNGILAFFTAVLAIFTWLLYKETKRARKQNETPQVSVYFYPVTPSYIAMRIENTGHIDAKDINVICLNHNRYKDEKHDFIYSEKLSKRFSCLHPRQEYSFMVGYYNLLNKEIFNFDVSFSNMNGKIKTKYHINIDMNLLQGILFEKTAEEKLATAVENFRKDFSSIIENDNGKKGIRVYQDSAEDRKIRNLEQARDFYREQLEELEARDSKD